MFYKSTIDEIRVGKPKKLFSATIKTAINKQPIEKTQINNTGLVGDAQAEDFHNHKDRAVLQFDSNHYIELKSTFPKSNKYLVNGGFGENFVVKGMNEHNMCIGDIVSVGTAILEVSQPRQPCFKLNHRFNEPSISRHAQNSSKTGWFYRVLTEGDITIGDKIEVIERPHPDWTVAKVQHYLYQETGNKRITEQLARLKPLGHEVKGVFSKRLEANDIEDWDSRLTGGSNEELEMRIVKIIDEFDGVKRFYLSRTNLESLPEFSAGAHITLKLPNGLSRSYSLCSPLTDDTYQISVGLAPESRGGSLYMHHSAKVGDVIAISPPANYFEMSRDKHHIFIAAGIGITPFLTMIREAITNNETFELHYCVNSASDYPFQEVLKQYPGCIQIYSLDKPLDIPALLDNHSRGTHVYSCGSPGFVDLVRSSASHWSANNVHFENFSINDSSEANTPFKLTIAETGKEIEVSAEQSILDALRDEGISTPSSCETGVCGQCKCGYKGDVDHRDTILTKTERKHFMTPCVSRAKSSAIEIFIG